MAVTPPPKYNKELKVVKFFFDLGGLPGSAQGAQKPFPKLLSLAIWVLVL